MPNPARPAPLFNWQQQQKIAAMRARRHALADAIRQRLPRSHRRVILEAQLAAITAELLRLEHESELPEKGQ